MEKVKTKKERPPKPKYNMWQNSAYMIRLAWSVKEKKVIFIGLAMALLTVALSLIELYVVPVILSIIETHAPIGEIIIIIAAFTAGLMAVTAAKSYFDINNLYGKISVRTEIINMINDKGATTSYPNLFDDNFNKLLSKSIECTNSNDKATEAVWETLRDLAANISRGHGANVLILDVRNEIAGATDEFYDLGDTVDVVRSCDKLSSLQSAVRAMKPDIVITDELYGKDDAAAVKFARDCGINVIASSHVCDRLALEKLPFDYYVKLNGINLQPEIYDKDFDIVSDNSADDVCGSTAFGGKKEEGDCVFPALRI